METNDSFPLPTEWEELKSILTNMKICRESGDAKGYNKYVEDLLAWRDMYPEEAFAVLKVLSEGDLKVLSKGDM